MSHYGDVCLATSSPSRYDVTSDRIATKSEISAALKLRASQLGFDLVGVAPAVSPTGFHDFREWLAEGFAGEMHYLPNREAAYEHPEHVLPDVRSVIMLAMNYHTTAPSPPHDASSFAEATIGGEGWGEGAANDRHRETPHIPARVSQYARGPADYHDVLRDRLKSLAALLHEHRPGCRTRGVVDTAPLLERDFARLAGLGWFGKNTMLINKRKGSWLFLAAMLTDIELDHDDPHASSHCGTCTRCLEACPTDAFPEPYVLDARKCISYLNIELKGPIPVDMREGVGDWLFGCDICQDVCPWNNKAPVTDEPAFQPAEDLTPADAVALLSLDEAGFRERFRKTPLWRPGRTGILRTAAIVLGNSGRSDAVPVLINALDDEDPVIRGAVAWALGQLGGDRAISALRTRSNIETDATVKREITDALIRADRGCGEAENTT